MSEIKSALEIALARTQDVKSDKEGLKAHDQREQGKRLISAYLNEHKDLNRLKAELEKVSPKERKNLAKGAFEILKANLVLPQTEFPEEVLSLMERGFALITGEEEEMKFAFQQLRQFYQQYEQSREQLKEAVKAQILPTLQAKAHEMSAQTGVEVEIDPEDYPEFAHIMAENMARVNEQFQVPLEQMKQDLEELLK